MTSQDKNSDIYDSYKCLKKDNKVQRCRSRLMWLFQGRKAIIRKQRHRKLMFDIDKDFCIYWKWLLLLFSTILSYFTWLFPFFLLLFSFLSTAFYVKHYVTNYRFRSFKSDSVCEQDVVWEDAEVILFYLTE